MQAWTHEGHNAARITSDVGENSYRIVELLALLVVHAHDHLQHQPEITIDVLLETVRAHIPHVVENAVPITAPSTS